MIRDVMREAEQSRPGRPTRRRAAIMLAGLAGLALAGMIAAPVLSPTRAHAEEAPAAAARPVLVTIVAFRPVRETSSFAGVVRARTETALGFRIGGKVASRLVSLGDPVKAGMVLARLDDVDQRLNLDSAKAELDAARSSLAQATADLARVRALVDKGFSTAAALDRQQAFADEAQGRVVRAERLAALAERNLSYVDLVASADGVVTETRIEPSQVVAAGEPAIRVASLAAKDVVVAIPEIMIERVRNGTATVELWSEPGHGRAARLRELSPIADPATRTFEARFALEGPADDVALGMSATLTLAEPPGPAAATLPISAILDTGGGPTVWVVGADGRLTRRPVTIAGFDAGTVRVVSGLAEGETVVTAGVHALQPEDSVRVLPPL